MSDASLIVEVAVMLLKKSSTANDEEFKAFIYRADPHASWGIDRSGGRFNWRTRGTFGEAWVGDYLLMFFGRVVSSGPEAFERWKAAAAEVKAFEAKHGKVKR